MPACRALLSSLVSKPYIEPLFLKKQLVPKLKWKLSLFKTRTMDLDLEGNYHPHHITFGCKQAQCNRGYHSIFNDHILIYAQKSRLGKS